MNIAQLKAAIAGNVNVLKAYYPNDAGMTDHSDYFFIKLYEKTGSETADDRSYCVVVKNRGLETEEVFFKGQMPQSMQAAASTAFKTKVEAFVAQYQTTHLDLKWWEFNSCDEAKKVARVTAYVLVTGELVPKQYLAYANGADVLQFLPIKAA